jgi:hypothetical protein
LAGSNAFINEQKTYCERIIGGNMKNIILTALIVTFAFAASSYGQTGGVSVSLSDLPDTKTVRIDAVFPTSFNGGVRVSEARLPATTQAACLAISDFSSAVPMNRSRFSVGYDAATNSYHFSFSVERAAKTSCRIVRFASDGDVDGRDFLLWQRGSSPSPVGLTNEEEKESSSEVRGSDGSVRLLRYSLANNNY